MENTKPVFSGLYKQPVYLIDTSETSPELFQIKEFPTQLNAGRNIFKIHGHYKNLRDFSPLYIEVLDYNNNPVYYEVLDDEDEDGSVVIVIYIYETTPAGKCTITLLGEAVYIDDIEVPKEWQRRSNIMWQKTVFVNPTKQNTGPIIFGKKPTILIQEQIGVQLDRLYDTTQFITYDTGSVKYISHHDSPVLVISGGVFVPDMIGGIVTINTPINPYPLSTYITSSIPYSTKIAKVLSTSSILLQNEYFIDASHSIYGHRYDSFDNSTYTINYEATPLYVPTENSESYALIEIDDLQPLHGDIARIKVFSNNSGTVGNWDLLSDVVLSETEIFVTSTSSIEPYMPIGLIKSSSIINTYYESASFNGFIAATVPSIIYNTTNLPNSLYINSQRDISAKNSVDILKIKDQYSGKFIKDAIYKFRLDAIGTRTSATGNSDPIISFYVSGSAFDTDYTDYFNQELPITVGKRIGYLRCKKDKERFNDYTVTFTANNTGTGILYYLIEGGQWQLADIHVTTNNDPGYTPNYTRIRTKIPTKHKSGVQQSFKIEYYNSEGVKSEHSTISEPIEWKGGNHYIDGDHNLITGSIFVADKLSSGIEFSGRKHSGYIRTVGYTGFNSKNKGILIWSGSALSGSTDNYKGTGVELYESDDNYFRFATDISETRSLYVKTKTFFLGNSTSSISADGGDIHISGSIIFDNITVPTASFAFTASYYKETDPVFTSLSSSLATTGSNNFSGSQTIYGDLTVIGTASFVSVTGSTIDAGTNLITLNTDDPSIRFGGMQVVDTGSFGNDSTGSMLWDSQKTRWIYSNPSGSAYDGGLIMSGPRNTSGVGEEVGVLNNFLTVGQGEDHISSSAIFHSESITQVTGSLLVTAGITGSLFGTASWSNNSITASYVVTSQTASYVLNSISSSYATNSETASYVVTAQTASYVLNSTSASYSTNAETASYITLAQTASYVLNAISASYSTNALSANSSQTASYVLNAISSSFATNSLTASYVANTVSSSYAVSASYSNIANTSSYSQLAQTASYTVSTSFATNANTASYVLNAVSASYTNFASTASYVLNAISSSFASTASYILNAVSASYSVSSSFATNSATASYIVTAQTASYVTLAQTASYIVTAQTASYVLNAISASIAQTASYILNAVSASYSITSSHVPNTFVQGGNSFGTSAILGTNDNQSLRFETANAVRMQISSSGQIVFGGTVPLILSGGLFQGVSPFMEMQTGDAVGTYNEAVVLRHANVDITAVTRSLGLVFKLSTEAMPNEAPKMGGMILRSTSAYANTPDLHFVSGNTEKMTINYNGNVGIGTLSPNTKLDVNGNVIISGSLSNGVNTLASSGWTHAEGINTTSSGQYSHAEGGFTVSSGIYSHAEGISTLAIGQTSHAEGQGAISFGGASHAEGYYTVASASWTHAEGVNTTALQSGAHSEGYFTTASNYYAHSEGIYSIASGYSSHAEGYYNQASGYSSHAEGTGTVASGDYSHAEGESTQALSQASHTSGWLTIASGSYQTVVGQYNKTSNLQGAFIIGNGNPSTGTRSNLVFASGSTFQVTGSIIATAGFTGSFSGSFSGTATSASFASTSSYVITAQTASYFLTSSVTSASFAQTASHVLNAPTLARVLTSNNNTGNNNIVLNNSTFTGTSDAIVPYNHTLNSSYFTFEEGSTGAGSWVPKIGISENVGLATYSNSLTFDTYETIIQNNYNNNVSGIGNRNGYGDIRLSNDTITLDVYDISAGNGVLVTITTASISVLSTTTTFSGINYSADYSASYTTRSLVDKGYVDNRIAITTASIAITALTASSVNILNQNVSITGSLNVSSSITASAFVTQEALITSTTLTANTGITTIYSIPTASYDGAWFDYTIRSGSNARAGTIFGLWSGSAVNYAENTTTDFGSTANFTFGMSINGSNMILSSSTTTNGWTVNSIIRGV